MAYQGFLSLGGTEIANAARTVAYVHELVPMLDIKDCWGCTDLAEVLGHDPYTTPMIDRPDWLSDHDPDSWDFCGLLPLEIEGLDDGVREASVTELALDGAVVGAPRYRSREIRVSGLLIGSTEAAVTYGLTWLAKALEGAPCREGIGCTGDHLCYYAACPPMCTDSPALDVWPHPTEPSPRHHASAFYLCDGGLIEDVSRACSVDYERTLYQVTATSGPSITERYNSICGAYVKVEFTLVAGVPFAFSTAISAVPGVDPIPNPQIAPEIACTPGSDVVVRTNLATNPIPLGNAAGTGDGWLADGTMFDVAPDTEISRLPGDASVRVTRNTVTDSPNLAPNPDPVDTLDGWSWRLGQGNPGPARTNLVENPWPRLSDGWTYNVPGDQPGTIVHTNLMPNPSVETSTASYSASPATTTMTRDDVWASSGEWSLKVAPTTGSTSVDTFAVIASTVYAALVPGTTYTITATLHLDEAHVSSSFSGNARRIRAYWTGSGTVWSDQAPNEAGDHTVSLTFTPTAALTALRLYNGAASGPDGQENATWWDNITIVEGTEAVQFNGDTSDTGDAVYSWTGEPHASTSIQRTVDAEPFTAPLGIVPTDPLLATNLIPNPSMETSTTGWGVNAAQGTIERSTEWAASGSASLLLRPLAANVGVVPAASYSRTQLPVVLTPGGTYTLTATCHIDAPVEGRSNTSTEMCLRAGFGIGSVTSPQPPNTAGDHVVSVTFTIPETTIFSQFLAYGARTSVSDPEGGNGVWWDNFCLVEGTLARQFNGDSPTSDQYVYAWTGTPHASTSTMSVNPEMASGPDGQNGYGFHVQGAADDKAWNITYTGTETTTAGATYTQSLYFRSTSERQVQFGGRTFDVPGFGWVRLTGQFVGDGGPLTLTVSGTGQADGELIDVARALVEAGTALGTYFDGSTPAADGYTYTWTGDADASTSTATLGAPQVTTTLETGDGPGEQTTFQRTTIVVPKAGSEDGPAYVMDAGEGLYTFTMDVRPSVGVSVSLRVSALDANGTVLTSQSAEELTVPANAWTTLGPVRLAAPAGTARLQVVALMPGGDALPVGATFDAGAVRVVDGLFLTDPVIGRVTYIGQHDNANTTIDVTPGGVYTASLYAGANVGSLATLSMRFYNASGTPVGVLRRGIGVELDAWTIPIGVAEWHRPSVTATAPTGAASAVVTIEVRKVASGAVLGDAAWVTSLLFEQADEVMSYFDGSTTDTDAISYEWSGTANASTSHALLAIPAEPSPILDPDCPVVPAPPRPPVIDISCVDTPSQWRRYVVDIGSDLVPEWRDAVPIVRMQTGSTAVRQVRVRFYPNPLSAPLQALNPCDYCGEFVITYIPANSLMTIDGIRQWVTVANVRTGEQVAANHLLASSDGGPVEWPVLGCGVAYTLVVDVSPIAVADLRPQICLAARS